MKTHQGQAHRDQHVRHCNSTSIDQSCRRRFSRWGCSEGEALFALEIGKCVGVESSYSMAYIARAASRGRAGGGGANIGEVRKCRSRERAEVKWKKPR